MAADGGAVEINRCAFESVRAYRCVSGQRGVVNALSAWVPDGTEEICFNNNNNDTKHAVGAKTPSQVIGGNLRMRKVVFDVWNRRENAAMQRLLCVCVRV